MKVKCKYCKTILENNTKCLCGLLEVKKDTITINHNLCKKEYWDIIEEIKEDSR